jgi:DNA polymerase-1
MGSSRQRTLIGFEPDEQPADAKPRTTNDSRPASKPLPAGQPSGPVSLASKSVYVVDAHSLIYQVFHAMPDMSGPTGQPVGAIHGFIRDMLDILEKKKPDFLFCAFDAPGGETFRHELYQPYKAQREEMPLDLQSQIPEIQRLLAALGIPALILPNYEADDLLATIAHQTESLGGSCVLVTGDKDCRQLISDHVRVYNIRKDELWGRAELEADWGIRPEQVVDYQSLVGDAVDNVPGVPLIGPKGASELLRQYETLDNLFAHLDQVTGSKRRENLRTYRDQALLSRDLVRLVRDAPIAIDWVAGRVGGVNRGAALELCRQFGFRRLADRIAVMSAADAPSAWQADYRTVMSLDELRELVERMRAQSRIVIDTETTDASPRKAELVGLSFAWQEGVAYYVPIRAPRGEPRLDESQVLAVVRPLLEDPAVEKIGQNLKYDLIVLRNVGVKLAGASFDTMVADYLLEPGERIHNLDDLAKRYLDHATIKIDELIGTGKKQKRMDEVPVPLITAYAAEDADVPLRLTRILERRLADEGLVPLFRDLEMPLVEVLAEMEFNGILVDVGRLEELSRRFGKRLQILETEIYGLAGGPFNIESPKQLARLLFDQLKLPVQRRTKTGPSTDADVLGDLALLHPLPAKIIEYRQNAKLKGTYVDALPSLVHPGTNRVHTSFKQDVAATGRLSSSDPNLQNIPIRTDEGREIRSAFLPGEPGWRFLAADYSQIELRVLAHYSGDEALQLAFREDRDIHAQVAAEVYGVRLDEVTRDMRRSAKAVNFGVIYGQSPFGLAKALGIPKEDAAQFIDKYFARYAGVAAFIRQTLEQCRRQGYVSTILGRRRPIQGIRDPARYGDSRQRTLPERIAINTVIQGSAADLIKRAMINVHRRLQQQRLSARLLLQIHDELLLEVSPEDTEQLERLVVDEMASAAQLAVPLKVDVKRGANWAEVE